MSFRIGDIAACLLCLIALGLAAGRLASPAWAGESPPHKILAVMSYDPANSWTLSEQEGIDQALVGDEIRYFYLDTKRDEKGGWEKGREALSLLEEFRPDAVIAADDSAQEMFVVPYLKGKSTVPVVFCGVNDDAAKYGYPAANITGVVEVKHYQQTISYAKLLIKGLRRVVVLYKENQANAINVAQVRREMGGYPVEVIAMLSVSSLAEARAVMEKYQGRVEAFLVLNLSGVIGDEGTPIDGGKAIGQLRGQGVALLATEDYAIGAGALCGVVQSGRLQGLRAGQMVRRILAGLDPREIPVEKNLNGQRYLNLSTARQLGLAPGPQVILGSKLLR
jgi:ABC-type uncharacterized transport system substrate-binding protein